MIKRKLYKDMADESSAAGATEESLDTEAGRSHVVDEVEGPDDADCIVHAPIQQDFVSGRRESVPRRKPVRQKTETLAPVLEASNETESASTSPRDSGRASFEDEKSPKVEQVKQRPSTAPASKTGSAYSERLERLRSIGAQHNKKLAEVMERMDHIKFENSQALFAREQSERERGRQRS